MGLWEKGWLFLCFIVFLTDLVFRLEKLLTIDRRKLRLNEEKETECQQEEMKKRYSEKVNEVDRLQREVSSALCLLF